MVFESESTNNGHTASPGLAPADLERLFGHVRNEPVHLGQRPRDAVVQCPNCKTIETLQFVGGRLMRSRKFFESDGKVYHDCGSKLPCRISR